MSQPTVDYLFTVPGLQGLLTTAGQNVTQLLTLYDENFSKGDDDKKGGDSAPIDGKYWFELHQQYLDCTSIVEFFVWVFSILIIGVAVIKWKVLFVSVAELNLDNPEILLLDDKGQTIQHQPNTQQQQDQKPSQQQSQLSNNNPINIAGEPQTVQKSGSQSQDNTNSNLNDDPDKNETKNDDDNKLEDDDAQQQKEQQEQVIGKEKNPEQNVQQDELKKEDDINLDINNDIEQNQQQQEDGAENQQNSNKEAAGPTEENLKSQSPPKQLESNNQQQQPVNNAEKDDSNEKKIQTMKTLVKVVEDFWEKYFVVWGIVWFLVINFGCYGYACFVVILIMFASVAINSLNLVEKKLPQFQGWEHLFYHFWVFTLFIAYFATNQQFYTNGTDSDKSKWVPAK